MTKEGQSSRSAPDSRHVLVAFLALLCAFGAAFSWTSWQTVRERELKSMTALAEFGEKSLDTYFAQTESALRVLAGEVRGADGEFDRTRAEFVLKRFKQAYPDLQIVIVTRPDGQIIASSDAPSGANLPTLAGEPSFVLGRDELMNGATLSMGRAFFGPISKQWIIPLRYGARDGKGSLLFLVGAGLPLAKPQSLWKDAPLPPNAAIGLLRDDGFLISRYPVPADLELAEVYGKKREGPILSALKERGFPAGGTVDGRSKVSGINTLFVFRRLSHYPLTFFVANPGANIVAAWWEQARVSYLLILMLGAGSIAVYRRALRRQSAWEREREQRMRELEEANRELQSFSHTVAHDLRAPLRHIDGFVNLWKDRAATADAEGLRLLAKVSAAATRMGRLIDDLLAFSRTARTGLSKVPVALGPLVADIVQELQPDVRGRAVEWEIGVLPTLDADRNLLRLALFNLLENAVKYTRTRATARIEIRCVENDGSAIITVHDNGVGFDMKYVHKLFKVFERLHGEQDFSGTGIGLATVARIVGRHHGRVWAEGQTGQGAVFSIALPIKGEA